MQFKSDTLQILRSFFAFVSTQFLQQVQTLRTDNALEFFSNDCNSLLTSLGIIHQRSCPYTSSTKWLVERKHRHILNIARAIKFQDSIPDSFWGECVLHAAYLINRIPTPLLANRIPFEALFNKPPSFAHTKIFGCLCYASNFKPIDKFDVCSKPYVFLGYPLHEKG